MQEELLIMKKNIKEKSETLSIPQEFEPSRALNDNQPKTRIKRSPQSKGYGN